MKRITIPFMLLFVALAGSLAAQPLDAPRKVGDVELTDLDKNPMKLPHFGEKNLMIFYVDPDKHKQNKEFTDDMEANHQIANENLFGFGVLNLKDAPLFPNSMVRSIARKRTETNHAVLLADKNHLLRDAWGLGDCNNQFVLLIVSKEGELVYVHKGELSPEDIEAFYQFVEKYR